jgi:hypothetical protein
MQKLIACLRVWRSRDAEALQSGRAAFPEKMYLELVLPKAEPVIHLNFYWFQKPATRLPEALWLSFDPIVSGQQGWMMDKSGEQVSPFDVVSAGNRHMHAVSTGFGYQRKAVHLCGDAGLTGDRFRREIAAEFFHLSTRSGRRGSLQSVQQRLGNKLHHVVR